MREMVPPMANLAKFKLLRRPALIKLTVSVTHACNSRCRSCNLWTKYRDDPGLRGKELTFEEYQSIFDQLDGLLWMELTGGEPFLRDDLERIVVAAFGTGISAAGLISNGLLTERVTGKCRAILEGIPRSRSFNMGISLDGERDMYETVRGIDGYHRALETLVRLREMEAEFPNLRSHAAYTITHVNAGKFQDFYETVSKDHGLGIDDISVTVEHFSDFYGNSSIGDKEYEEFRRGAGKDISCIAKLQSEVRERRRGLSVDAVKDDFYRFYIDNIPLHLQEPKRMILDCTAAGISAYIDPYGDVFPCTMWSRRLGNVREASIDSIIRSDGARKARDLIRKRNCPVCWTPCEAQPSYLASPIRVLGGKGGA